MFYHDSKLQYTVRVDTPNPLYAKMLQQAIGGVEGEIRVMMQYLFQAFGSRGPTKYRDMLMETGTEEMGHVEMLATAVALNLEGAPTKTVEEAAKDPMVEAVLGGMNPRHLLSSGLGAMPVNSNGVPFDCSHVYATGNIAADMYANVTAESGGRALGGAALQPDRRPRHEGHAQVLDRPRHHAPGAVVGGFRRARRAEQPPHPQLVPARRGAARLQLRFLGLQKGWQ